MPLELTKQIRVQERLCILEAKIAYKPCVCNVFQNAISDFAKPSGGDGLSRNSPLSTLAGCLHLVLLEIGSVLYTF